MRFPRDAFSYETLEILAWVTLGALWGPFLLFVITHPEVRWYAPVAHRAFVFVLVVGVASTLTGFWWPWGVACILTAGMLWWVVQRLPERDEQ